MEQVRGTPGMSVLVLDPHEEVRSGLVLRLRRGDGVALANGASSVGEAAGIITSVRPDVVLFDPGGWDGQWRAQLSALDALRQQASVRFLIGLHVVRRTDPHTCEALSLGADFILLKGMRTHSLVELLANEVYRAATGR